MQIERKSPPKPVKKTAGGEQTPPKQPFDEVLKRTQGEADASRRPFSKPRPEGETPLREPGERAPVRRKPSEEERAARAEETPTPAEPSVALGANPQSSNAVRTETVAGPSAAATVQALADEIVAVVGPEGVRELQVEVDSAVIDDLRIAVSRDDNGELAVRLMTDSAQTAKLLQDNLGQLAAALSARSVQVAAIQVTPRVNPSASAASAKSQRERDRRERERR